MEKNKLQELKENKEVKYIYKLPCSLYDDGFEYIVIGNVTSNESNVKILTLDQ